MARGAGCEDQKSAPARGAVSNRSRVVYSYQPVGMDIFDVRPNQPARGTLVVKTQPYGCPPNGTMGHCYIADAETEEFYGLVLENSLQPQPIG